MRHDTNWSGRECPLHNSDFPDKAEAARRGQAGEQHIRCPRCNRRVWVRDFYTRRMTDGRLREAVEAGY